MRQTVKKDFKKIILMFLPKHFYYKHKMHSSIIVDRQVDAGAKKNGWLRWIKILLMK